MTTPIDRLLFEVADRLVRLLSHVQGVSRRVDRGDAGLAASRKVCAAVEQVLCEFCAPLVATVKFSANRPQRAAEVLLAILEQLKSCHLTLLNLLPRPGQPVELRSFLRQIVSAEESASSTEQRGLYTRDSIVDLVFANESLTDQAFELDPAGGFAQRARQLVEYLQEAANTETFDEWRLRRHVRPGGAITEGISSSEFVAIPLIDLHNPCRWPSLTHELGHHQKGVSPESLEKEFQDFLGEESAARLLVGFAKWLGLTKPDERAKRALGSWLLECFCDAYGASLVGYSAWYSQLQAFFFTDGEYLFTQRATKPASYPPAFFRLRVLDNVLKSRYEYADPELHQKVRESVSVERELFLGIVRFVPSMNSRQKFDQLVGSLAPSFTEFLREKLRREGAKTKEDIKFDVLDDLRTSLARGEPIPVARSGDTELHRRCRVTEILLAGWMNRNTAHLEEVLGVLKGASANDAKTTVFRIQALVERFDESLRRSIQVAEWVDLLKSSSQTHSNSLDIRGEATETNSEPEKQLGKEDSPLSGLLVDREIKLLLRAGGGLCVIPVIDEAQQIGSSSIDVRLGHNFEVFFANIHGPIDVCEPQQNDESRYVEIDHLDGIMLSPGQFVLAHTLEYIRLPPNLAAQLEGRSSFARMGIQIHMTAGFVDAGFEGSLTLEIANFGPAAVKLYPGMRIAQLRLFRVSSSERPYSKNSNIKYRGLLSQNKTRQFIDSEVDMIKNAIAKARESGRKR